MALKSISLIAHSLGMDIADLRDYRYHYGLTRIPLYAVGNEWFCVKRTKPTPKDLHDMELEWEPYPDQGRAKDQGTIVWYAKS